VDINALKTFLEVAKTRHFGQAADNLFVSQSTVSARIRALEENLATELFVRERSNIHLTKNGEALVSHAKSILTLWGRARREVAMPDDVQHSLIVGGLSGLWDITLQNWLAEVTQGAHSMAIRADTFSAATLLERVTSGTMDIGFLYDAPQGLNLISQPLTTIKLILVSSQHNQSVDDAMGDYFINVDWGVNFAVQFAAQFPELSASKLTTGLGRIAFEYIKRNKGTAYLAEPVVESSLTSGELFLVNNAPSFERKAYAIYHQENEKADLIQNLISSL